MSAASLRARIDCAAVAVGWLQLLWRECDSNVPQPGTRLALPAVDANPDNVSNRASNLSQVFSFYNTLIPFVVHCVELFFFSFFLLFVFWKKLLVPLFANNEKLQVDLLVSTTPATLRRLLLSDKLFLSTIMHCVRLVKRKKCLRCF